MIAPDGASDNRNEIVQKYRDKLIRVLHDQLYRAGFKTHQIAAMIEDILFVFTDIIVQPQPEIMTLIQWRCNQCMEPFQAESPRSYCVDCSKDLGIK